ncbi:MAG: alpha/beta family hydrolase [Patescibacteria group bacterium]
MNNLTSFYFYHNSKSNTLDVILCGGSYGIDTDFMQKVFTHSKEKGNGVILFNFPYFERGEEHSSGEELLEELETLQKMLDVAGYKNYKKIRLIAKSLGGIVASFCLDKLPKSEHDKFEIIILGFVVGSPKLNNFTGKITIIQGQKDKFGGIEAVKKELINAKSKNIRFIEIPNANHSFKDAKTDKPAYEDIAINSID